METTARYVLQGILKYAASDGDMAEAQFIEMNAPTGKHARQVAHLRQCIVKAIVEDNDRNVASGAAESTVPTPDPEATGVTPDQSVTDGIDVINIMARSSVNLGDTYKIARDLFILRGVLKVDGEVQMTATLIDNMTAQDFETLVGSYIANFTLPS